MYTKVGTKRNYKKTDYCTYCGGQYTSKLSKHLMNVHMQEEEVKLAMISPVGSKKRKAIWTQIMNEGNYKHNTKVHINDNYKH